MIFNTVMLLEGKLTADMTIEEVLTLRKDFQERKAGIYACTGPFFVNGTAIALVGLSEIVRPGGPPEGLPEGGEGVGANPSPLKRTCPRRNSCGPSSCAHGGPDCGDLPTGIDKPEGMRHIFI